MQWKSILIGVGITLLVLVVLPVTFLGGMRYANIRAKAMVAEAHVLTERSLAVAELCIENWPLGR
jgi:hypothetical protein